MADFRAREVEDPRQRLPQRAETQAREHERREPAAAFAGDQHLGAGGAFGIGQHAVLLDDERAAERHHHQDAENAAGKREQEDLRVVEVVGAPPATRKISAGIVNTTPPATDSPAEPIVWTMLFSRIVEPPSFFSTEIASTAIGIDAETVSPARSPRYTVDAPKITPKTTPMRMAFAVNSAGDCDAGMYG